LLPQVLAGFYVPDSDDKEDDCEHNHQQITHFRVPPVYLLVCNRGDAKLR
jgi:hypothetical protein